MKLGDIMLYTSTQNNKIKELKKLNIKKYRDIENKFLIEGEHLVTEAFKNNILEEVIILEGNNFEFNILTSYVSLNVMKFISELDNPPKIIGVCKKIDNINMVGNKILMLDNVQDPGNLGTIIRSAVAFNIDMLVLSEDTVDLYNSKVIRASQGMMFSLPIIKTNLKEEIIKLKEAGYKIYSTNVKNGKSLKNVEKSEKFVIIMGNEGLGVKDELSELADEYLYIDMNSSCESLNVAVATSIILYELDK